MYKVSLIRAVNHILSMMHVTRSAAKTVILVSSIILVLEAFNVQGGNLFGSHGVGNLQINLNKQMTGSVHKKFRSIESLRLNGGATGLENEDDQENVESTLIPSEEEVEMNEENLDGESVVVVSTENEVNAEENHDSRETENDASNSSSPSSTSDQPIRISTSRKFGMLRNVSGANQAGKMTRKERRAQKRQKKLEEKSHRQIAKKLKVRP